MTRDTVVRNIARPAGALVEFFSRQTAADVHEAMDKRGAMGAEVRPVAGPAAVCGPAVTAHVPPGDNTMVHVAAEVARPGDVIVIESDTIATATWGELATRNAQRKELAGVVSGGNVRDVDAIDELGFPVFSRAVSQRGARKEGGGSVNVPVSVGGVLVDPGDILVGDRDGVTVVPQGAAARIKDATVARRETEDELRAAIDEGSSLYDALGIARLLKESDVTQVQEQVDYSREGRTDPN